MSRVQSQEELIKLLKDQMSQQQQQMEALLAIVQQQNKTTVTNTKFGEFDPSVELWSDDWARFETFTKANVTPDDRRAEIFLTNQSSEIAKFMNWNEPGPAANTTERHQQSLYGRDRATHGRAV
ncbi:hypothetical protein PoB_000909900 [Plakobranchus ocellatus]|uniref:Uncharacterized protein n=1 Tax=Plakobranchus ocellatus TaxID=259542 RepID=A0AAV3YJY0_9GAST|nr:hypothetical protein PoB_000909900 [Plakobranchus ocellatus]